MNGRALLEAMSYVDARYVAEAEQQTLPAPARSWPQGAALAACLCLVFALAGLWNPRKETTGEACSQVDGAEEQAPAGGLFGKESASTAGNTPAEAERSPAADRAFALDMEAFFFYQGKRYTSCGTVENGEAVLGEYLGTVTDMVNEWTQEAKCGDLSGTVCGDFYAVQNVEPELMLCMKQADGSVLIFLNQAETAEEGAKLLEELQQLSEQEGDE